MKISTIYYSSHFARVFKKIPPEIKKQAIQQERLFRNNCFDHRLKTHKLHGGFTDVWAFSVNYSYRIMFEFQQDGSVLFMDIGPHNIYQ